jgi:hypothetical protein
MAEDPRAWQVAGGTRTRQPGGHASVTAAWSLSNQQQQRQQQPEQQPEQE